MGCNSLESKDVFNETFGTDHRNKVCRFCDDNMRRELRSGINQIFYTAEHNLFVICAVYSKSLLKFAQIGFGNCRKKSGNAALHVTCTQSVENSVFFGQFVRIGCPSVRNINGIRMSQESDCRILAVFAD